MRNEPRFKKGDVVRIIPVAPISWHPTPGLYYDWVPEMSKFLDKEFEILGTKNTGTTICEPAYQLKANSYSWNESWLIMDEPVGDEWVNELELYD